MNELLSKVILCTVVDSDEVRETRVVCISPNGKYVNLSGERVNHEHIGWVRCVDVQVLDVLL